MRRLLTEQYQCQDRVLRPSPANPTPAGFLLTTLRTVSHEFRTVSCSFWASKELYSHYNLEARFMNKGVKGYS